MAFPKNKRRKIVIDGVSYEWCFSAGTLFYKTADSRQKLIAVEVDTWHIDNAITPARVALLIKNRIGGTVTPKLVADNKKKFDDGKLKDRASYKLYVWEDVLTDWSSGMMVAYARSLKEAREQIIKACGYNSDQVKRELAKAPTHTVSGKSKGFLIWGGS
jgi:hypothetical protein